MGIYFDKLSEEAVDAAVDALENCGVALLPADTVYGFFGRADDRGSMERVYEIKQRDRGKPFALYTNELEMSNWVHLNATAQKLVTEFWPQALSLVLPKREDTIPDWFGGGTPTVGVLTATNPLITAVIERVNGPLFGTTVNYSGEPSITLAEEAKGFLDVVDVMVGDDSIPIYNRSSTIVDCSVDPPAVIREDAIPIDDLRAVIPDIYVDLGRRK